MPRMVGMGEGWRRWVPLALILLILVLAPVLAYGQTPDTVVVRWTAPGDDGDVGVALAYDLRVSESPITEDNFDQALRVFGMPAPVPAGSRQQVTVRGLSRGTTYFFAIRSLDDLGNRSDLSNLVRWDWILDAAPPSAPDEVAATRGDDGIHLSWAPNPEADLQGYRVYRATAATGPFTLLTPTAITTAQFVDTKPPSNASMLWYRITAIDANGNESASSASLTVGTVETHVAAVEVTVEEGYPNPATIWTPVRIPVVIPASGADRTYVEVLDSGNRRVRRIEVGHLAGGRHEIVWDGRNDVGQVCAPGVYRGWFVTDTDRLSIRLVRVP